MHASVYPNRYVEMVDSGSPVTETPWDVEVGTYVQLFTRSCSLCFEAVHARSSDNMFFEFQGQATQEENGHLLIIISVRGVDPRRLGARREFSQSSITISFRLSSS